MDIKQDKLTNNGYMTCCICLEKPKKLIKCFVCSSTFVCLECYDGIVKIDESNCCNCCSYDARLFLTTACPICRTQDKKVLTEKVLKNFSRDYLMKLILDYNERTIDRVNRTTGVNRYNQNIPNNYFVDSDNDSITSDEEHQLLTDQDRLIELQEQLDETRHELTEARIRETERQRIANLDNNIDNEV